MQTAKLNNGVEMPMLGFGTFQIRDPHLCEECVSQALELGYRLIDTAAAYLNEEAVGQAIRKSGLPRAEIFVTTKLWIQDAGYESTLRAFERSLERLQLDYLDLYLIHQPFGDVHCAWRAMEELYRAGRVRAIGVSNFSPDRLMDLIVHHEIVPAVDQLEVHPFYQQQQTLAFLQAHEVQLQAWAPFSQGRNSIFDNELLSGIAKSHGKTVAQVVLRWHLQRGVAVIPKSVHRERIAENADIFGFSLAPEEMEAIGTLDAGASSFFDFRDPEQVRRLSSVRLEI